MTTPDQSKGDRSHDEVLAGEYVVGVLDAKARRAVEERMRRDRSFAAIVHRWEENLSGFDSEYVHEMPPVQLFTRVEAQIHGLSENDDRRRGGLFSAVWGSVVFWRGVSLASLCGIAVVAVSQFIGSSATSSAPLVARMAGKDNAISLIAHYDNSSGRLKVTPVATAAETERSLELWLIEGSAAPRSLGVLPQTGEGEIAIPADMRGQFGAGIVLAVSIEPLGGSPTGEVTGPVLAAGEAHF